jgi:hypothetical protein
MEELGAALPTNTTGIPVVHHGKARTGLWQSASRFKPFHPPLPTRALIVEVGGNTVSLLKAVSFFALHYTFARLPTLASLSWTLRCFAKCLRNYI